MSTNSSKFPTPVVRAIGLVLTVAMLGLFASTLRADVRAQQVKQAIQRGVRYLKNQQRANGSWQPYGLRDHGGMTSLCTLALLESGVPVEDPHVKRALTWLRAESKKITSTYAVSLLTMVLAKADPKRDLLLIQRNTDRLQNTQLPNGVWAYPIGDGDPSNTQFALLALYAAEQVGAKIDARIWKRAKLYWENCQNTNGSWGYGCKVPGTGSMTCAGLSSLVIVNDAVRSRSARVNGDEILCCLPATIADDPLHRGLRWLGKNFTVRNNPGESGGYWGLYYLYGLERVGRLTAHRFIGQHDWYREGADYLVNRGVLPTDYWTGKTGLEQNNRLLATSFALLFLSKGRRPVLIAKAAHGEPQNWDVHPSDVASLTRFVEKKWKREMTWQVIDVEAATIDDLVETPVLYFSGKENPLPKNPAERKALAKKLRGYLDQGGFIFAEGYCRGCRFDTGFRQLVEEIFPEPEYALRLLDINHPIWSAEERVPPNLIRPIYGVNFGCRTSLVYFPSDPPSRPRPSLSCLWELSRPGRKIQYNESVETRIHTGLVTGMNVLAYATGRELRTKDEVLRPTPETGSSIERRNEIAIATIRHPGGCTAAPLAVVRLLETASEKLGVRTRPEQKIIHLTDDALFDYHLVFFHGRSAFHLTDRQRRRLREFVERGGTVFADSICASKTFTESFRREMATIFTDPSLEKIPATDPIFSTKYGGYDVRQVERQDPPEKGSDTRKPTIKKVPPSLEGIRINGRWAVIFSPYDVSCALQRHNSIDCRGYTRESAAQIALNVLLYSLQE